MFVEPLIPKPFSFYFRKTCLTLNNNNSFTDCTHYRPTIEGLAALGALYAYATSHRTFAHGRVYARNCSRADACRCTRMYASVRIRASIHARHTTYPRVLLSFSTVQKLFKFITISILARSHSRVTTLLS